jgi:ribosomal protein S18 acetylase RimI-like enzyme
VNGYLIREATAADAKSLVALMLAYWAHEGIAPREPDSLRRQVEQFLSTPAYGQGWLAVAAEEPVGYLLCTFVYSFEHGGPMAEIDELFVDAQHRQQGIGRALLQRAQGHLAERGYVALQMQVSEHNARAQHFWARLGLSPKAGYRLWLAPLGTWPKL